jgi:hypothetical protein
MKKIYGQFPRRVDKLPNAEFYTIITETSGGDDWGGREDFLQHEVFFSKDEWISEIKRLTATRSVFKAMKCIPAVISTTVEVNVE